MTKAIISCLKPLLALSPTFGFHSSSWEAPAGAGTLLGKAAQGFCLPVAKGQGRKEVTLPSAAPSPFLGLGRAYRGSSCIRDSKGKVSKGRGCLILQPEEQALHPTVSPAHPATNTLFLKSPSIQGVFGGFFWGYRATVQFRTC